MELNFERSSLSRNFGGKKLNFFLNEVAGITMKLASFSINLKVGAQTDWGWRRMLNWSYIKMGRSLDDQRSIGNLDNKNTWTTLNSVK